MVTYSLSVSVSLSVSISLSLPPLAPQLQKQTYSIGEFSWFTCICCNSCLEVTVCTEQSFLLQGTLTVDLDDLLLEAIWSAYSTVP